MNAEITQALHDRVLSVVEVREKLGREQEVLLPAVAARVRDAVEDVPLVGRVHRLAQAGAQAEARFRFRFRFKRSEFEAMMRR